VVAKLLRWKLRRCPYFHHSPVHRAATEAELRPASLTALCIPALKDWVFRAVRVNEHFRLAIQIDPADQIARGMLVRLILNETGMNTHEIPTGYGYLGEPNQGFAPEMKLNN
jgi:hypothetical protein